MSTTDRDAQIMDEADKQRKHQLSMATIEADLKRSLAATARQRAESRNEMIGYFGVGLAIVVVIAIIISAIEYGVIDGRKDHQLRERQRNEIAQTCIRDGNIWINGDCVPAKKS